MCRPWVWISSCDLLEHVEIWQNWLYLNSLLLGLHIDGSKDNTDTCCSFLVKLNNVILNLVSLFLLSHFFPSLFTFKHVFLFFTLSELNNIALATKTFNNIWSLFITLFGSEDMLRVMLEEKKCLSAYSIVLCFVDLLMIKMKYCFDMNAM